jgi:hypothetical protein
METGPTVGPGAGKIESEPARKETNELDDHELEFVVGGLARAWTRAHGDGLAPTTWLDDAAH